MKAILSPNPYRDRGLKVAQTAARILLESGCDIRFCLPFELDSRFELPRTLTYSKMEEEIKTADILICFGGDGTLLHAAKLAYQHDIPVLGVNMGSVGFMAELEHSELRQLSRLVKGDYKTEPRMMLEVSLLRDGKEVFTDLALNDAVITKGTVARVVDLAVTSDGELMSTVSGDGIVVATPTGSTAYSLSAGGPVVEPTAENMIVTPICAHALQSKSFVLPRNRTIEIKMAKQSRKCAFLSVDGGRGVRISNGDVIRIRTSERSVSLARLTNRSFYQILQTKLGRI